MTYEELELNGCYATLCEALRAWYRIQLDILPRMNAGDSRILRFGFLFATTKQERRGR